MGAPAPMHLGRYTLHAELASGGMATVHLGRLVGHVGFGRTVAIKRLHPQYAKNLDFVKMFLDEARLAARIQHPNVVPTLDVVAENGELFVVLELVKGEAASTLARTLAARQERTPLPIVASIIVGALNGLEAAHEARDERGEALGIVHRDISPQNVMVGADGVARLLDFGIAKARARVSSTLEGHLKGKLAYMAPEQFGGDASRRSDVYSVGVVLWELLTGRKLFEGDSEVQVMALVQRGAISPPSDFRADIPPELDRICARALAKDPADRYPSAVAMARDLDRGVEVASSMRVSEWMTEVVGPLLERRDRLVAEVESGVREVSRETLDELEALSGSHPPPSFEEAATKAVATVSSMAKAAEGAMRDRARQFGNKAARDLGALATALKVPPENAMLKRALAPLVSKPNKPEITAEKAGESSEPKTDPDEPTRAARRPR